MTDRTASWGSADDLVSGISEHADDDVVVMNPPEPVIRSIVTGGLNPTFRVVMNESAAKDVFSDFITASHAAELIRDGQLEVRTHENQSYSPTLATGEFFASATYTSDGVVGLGSNSTEAETVSEANRDAFDNASDFGFRTPPHDTVVETLGEQVGEDVRDDFVTAMEAVDALDGDRPRLDEVEVLLLLGAKNESLLYDLSKWGEDINLASKATFSRAKSRLEERDLIHTVKVPIEVGRPRLRLLLPEDLSRADTVELLESASERFE